MPRDGSGVYSKPWPSVVDGTTIESAVYNGFTDDVAVDLNAVRPVIAGGTGAANATTARFNVAAEAAAQLVTNYDTHVWQPGSFRSAASATSAPTANVFVGTAILNETLANPPTNANVMIEAHDMTTGIRYRRIKAAGSWGAWGDVAATFLKTTGGTMTGALAGTSMTMSGTITAVAKGHQFGNSGGTVATSAVARTDANVLLYSSSTTNWSGIGADGSGNMWFKTGTSGTPIPALWINAANQVCTFTADSLSIASSNAAANPALTLTRAGTLQSLINDNGTSINVCSNSTGSVGMYIAHGASAWSALSDARLPYKKTAEPMAVLDRLHGVQLYEGRVEGRRELFVKAQEFNKVFPQLVIQGSGPEDYVPTGMSDRAAWGVTYDRAGVVALQGLKELLARVEVLEKQRDG